MNDHDIDPDERRECKERDGFEAIILVPAALILIAVAVVTALTS